MRFCSSMLQLQCVCVYCCRKAFNLINIFVVGCVWLSCEVQMIKMTSPADAVYIQRLKIVFGVVVPPHSMHILNNTCLTSSYIILHSLANGCHCSIALTAICMRAAAAAYSAKPRNHGSIYLIHHWIWMHLQWFENVCKLVLVFVSQWRCGMCRTLCMFVFLCLTNIMRQIKFCW